jgi:DNA-binding MarR family transcriptional regulator
MVEVMSTPSSGRPGRAGFDSPEQEVFLNLWRTYDRLRALEEELFARHELTPQQYNALRLLRAAHPGSLPTLALAGRLVSRAPDITRLLDRLEDRGLVRRDRPADNRRVVRVAITDAGLALLVALAGPVRACHARQLGHLSPEQLRQLSELLREARRPHEEPGSGWR